MSACGTQWACVAGGGVVAGWGPCTGTSSVPSKAVRAIAGMTSPTPECSDGLPVCCRYNTAMKLIFLGTSATIVYYMRWDPVVKSTYDRKQDTFRYVFLIVPCFVLALLIHHIFSFTEVRDGWEGAWSLARQAPTGRRRGKVYRQRPVPQLGWWRWGGGDGLPYHGKGARLKDIPP